MLNKPLKILTSKETFSAGEECCYDFQTLSYQNLLNAELIGEVTKKGAHPSTIIDISDEFNIFMPISTSTNAFTNTDWEGVGVQPDKKTPAKDALITAHLDLLEQFGKINSQENKLENYDTVTTALSNLKSSQQQHKV